MNDFKFASFAIVMLLGLGANIASSVRADCAGHFALHVFGAFLCTWSAITETRKYFGVS